MDQSSIATSNRGMVSVLMYQWLAGTKRRAVFLGDQSTDDGEIETITYPKAKIGDFGFAISKPHAWNELGFVDDGTYTYMAPVGPK